MRTEKWSGGLTLREPIEVTDGKVMWASTTSETDETDVPLWWRWDGTRAKP